MSFEIIVPGRFMDIDTPSTPPCGVEGWFTLRAIRRGRVVRERTFKNLITDLGLDKLSGNASNCFQYFQAGIGTATPSVLDTTLANYIAGFGNTTSAYTSGASGTPGSAGYYLWTRVTGTSSIGAFGNNNLTEVGVGSQLATGNLYSRALILDGMGAPTTFPIASDEQLQITYEARLYPPSTDTLATVTVGASSFDTVTRPYRVNSQWGFDGHSVTYSFFGTANYSNAHNISTQAIGSQTATLSGLSSSTNYSNTSYTNGNHYRDGGGVFGTSVVGTFKTFVYQTGATWWQVGYTPDIVKTNIQELRLNQRVSWARR